MKIHKASRALMDIAMATMEIPKDFYPVSYWARIFKDSYETSTRNRLKMYVRDGDAEVMEGPCFDKSRRCSKMLYYKIHGYSAK